MYRILKHIIRFYSSEQQLTVYDSMLEESASLRRQHAAYRWLKRFGLGYWVLVLYGFRTAGRYDVSTHYDSTVLGFSVVTNNQQNMEHIRRLSENALVPSYICDTAGRGARVKNMLKLASKIMRPDGWRSVRKTAQIVKFVDRRHGWIQAVNVSSFLFGVFAFRNAFGPDNKIGFTANDFSPIPLAFKYAGRKAGLKQMFVMHGQISSAESGNTFPRLDYDVAFLYGDAALQAYKAGGSPLGKVVLTGFPGVSQPLRKVPDPVKSIGVCLANYYDADTYEAILDIGKTYPQAEVYVRCHPRCDQRPDFSNVSNIALSDHSGINDFAQACNFVIAGNTGGQIDLLKQGCPVLHYPALDKLGEDDIGLVADGTVPLFRKNNPMSAAGLNNHFDREWVKKFRKYDSQYMASEEETAEMRQEVRNTYLALLEDGA